MKKIAILTGGGDVQPLNSVIFSAIKKSKEIGIELIGVRYGWQGLLDCNFTELNINCLTDPFIGGTVLKSSRVNLKKIKYGAEQVKKSLVDNKIDGLIVIGGEDTLSNSLLLTDVPQVLISKTIDNDVGIAEGDKIVNHFTLGHPTAAEKISGMVSLESGLRTTAYSHERIIIVESMGMHAGWLALSSSIGNPDFIILPEFGIEYDYFVEMITERYIKQRHLIVVVAEGAKWSNGKYISADESEIDSFGHPRFKGAASVLGEMLKRDLKKYFDTRNVNWVNPSYLYRSGKPNNLDFESAKRMGETAVYTLAKNYSANTLLTTSIVDNNLMIWDFPVGNLHSIEEIHRFVPWEFYDKGNFCITEKGIEFLSPLVGKPKKNNYGI